MINMVNYVKFDYNEKTRRGNKHVSRGLIPEKIWNRPSLQKYVNDYPFGYIGALERRKTTDRAVVKYFKDAKKSDKFIEEQFLTNARGRHLADSFYKKSEAQIYKALEREFGKVKKK